MIEFRKSHPVLSRENFYTAEVIQWFNQQGNEPDWSAPQEKWLACRINDPQDQELFLIFNPDNEAQKFNLPAPRRGGNWRLAADTARPSPEDIFSRGEEIPLENQDAYQVMARSSVILIAQV
jgi:isoamylase